MIKLSKRLQAVADMIPKCESIADICSDHAFLPIYCVEKKICKTAIAGDIAKGPCEQGLRQVKKYSLEKYIDVRCGSGLKVIDPNEVSGVVMAGVGGSTIIDILESSKDIANTLDFLVVQPQNGFATLRYYFMHNNYKIIDEALVEENDIVYQIMIVEKGEMVIESDIQARYGSINLIKKKSELFKMLKQDLNHYCRVKDQLNASNSNKLDTKKSEIDYKINKIKEVFEVTK